MSSEQGPELILKAQLAVVLLLPGNVLLDLVQVGLANRYLRRRGIRIEHRPYALTVLAASIALVGGYIVVAEASNWSKALVMALLLASFAGVMGCSFGWRLASFWRSASGRSHLRA